VSERAEKLCEPSGRVVRLHGSRDPHRVHAHHQRLGHAPAAALLRGHLDHRKRPRL